MKDNNIHVTAIIIEKRNLNSLTKNLRRILKKGYIELIRFIFKKVAQYFFRTNAKEWDKDEYYYSFSDKVITVDNFNGSQCQQIAKELAPDIIVLGGARIIRDNIISIPQIGVLNAHPGLLPEYRGVDVIPWAILNGDEVGVTVHFIDDGVDTGRICNQEVLPILKGDSLQTLDKRAEILAGQLMAKTILSIIKNGMCHIYENPKEKGKQYYSMDYKKLCLAERQLKERIKNEK